MDKYFHPTLYRARDYLSMLELQLIHVSKRVPWDVNDVCGHHVNDNVDNQEDGKIDDALQWRYNGSDVVLNHQPHHCLLNRLFRCRSKKTSKLRVAGLCAGNSPVNGEFPAQRPVTQKMFPFDDVIMGIYDDGNGDGDAYKGGIDDTSDIHDNNIGGCDWGHIKHVVESTWFLVRTFLDRKHFKLVYNMIIHNSQQRCVKWMP